MAAKQTSVRSAWIILAEPEPSSLGKNPGPDLPPEKVSATIQRWEQRVQAPRCKPRSFPNGPPALQRRHCSDRPSNDLRAKPRTPDMLVCYIPLPSLLNLPFAAGPLKSTFRR